MHCTNYVYTKHKMGSGKNQHLGSLSGPTTEAGCARGRGKAKLYQVYIRNRFGPDNLFVRFEAIWPQGAEELQFSLAQQYNQDPSSGVGLEIPMTGKEDRVTQEVLLVFLEPYAFVQKYFWGIFEQTTEQGAGATVFETFTSRKRAETGMKQLIMQLVL